MDDRDIARAIAVSRIGFGVGFLAAPALTARAWLGPASSQGRVKVSTRAVGARDLVLGLGLLRAIESGDSPRPWLQAGAAVDALDSLATLASFRQLPKLLRFGVLGLGVGAAVVGFRLAASLD